MIDHVKGTGGLRGCRSIFSATSHASVFFFFFGTKKPAESHILSLEFAMFPAIFLEVEEAAEVQVEEACRGKR